MSTSAYTRCLDAMYGMRRFGIILGLETISDILAGLGNPQETFSAIHVAGTNGKGSIASALATILQQAGYRVGLYTSPHLIRFNERICVNGQPVSDDDVVASWEAVKSVHHGDREPTFFEFSTAMAFHEFGRQAVDYAVIETGMGGRMDATNVVSPIVSIITNISLEHKTYLGDTIAAITGEKAGIIKPGIPVVTGVCQKSAKDVVEKIAADQSSPVFMKGRDFRVRRNGGGRFSYWGVGHRWTGLQTALIGGAGSFYTDDIDADRVLQLQVDLHLVGDCLDSEAPSFALEVFTLKIAEGTGSDFEIEGFFVTQNLERDLRAGFMLGNAAIKGWELFEKTCRDRLVVELEDDIACFEESVLGR